MKILGLDTTRKRAKIYLQMEDKQYVLNMMENVKHSEGLFLYLEKALFENNLKVNDFDYFSAIVGPGSFTGIRVGMSVIKAFNQVANKKIVAVNMFEILKNEYRDSVILLNSTSTSCYYAEIKKCEIVGAGVIDKSEIAEKFASKNIVILDEEKELIGVALENVIIVDEEVLNNLYFKTLLKKIEKEDFGTFEPYYLQLSQAERNLKND